MKRIHAFSALAASLLACGGNNSATSRNNPGTGTSSLLVTADVDGKTTGTTFTVDVQDGLGRAVSGATVAFGNPSLPGGVIALVESPAGSGTYIGSTLSFPPGDFQLAVTKGADAVQGVVAGGPGVHTVNAPTVNSPVAANQPLAVSWTPPTQANQA